MNFCIWEALDWSYDWVYQMNCLYVWLHDALMEAKNEEARWRKYNTYSKFYNNISLSVSIPI